MRFTETLGLCALLGACGKPAELTPPIQAPLPASTEDAEAAPKDRLPEDTHPEAYRLELEVDPAQPSYRGQVSIELRLDRPRESIWLHSRSPRVSSVRVEREGADPLTGELERVGDSGLAAVRLRQPVGPGRARLVMTFEADFGAHLAGLYRTEAAGSHYAFTQFEPISAREAFPCFDEPRFKTPFELVVRVPRASLAIANTRVLEEHEVREQMAQEASAEAPDAGEQTPKQPAAVANEHVWREVHFAPTEKLPTYLVALAVGPFDLVSASVAPNEARERPLPLRGVAVRGRGAELEFALRETPALLSWLERYFAVAYPYDKLDLIAVPDFGAGAMENAGAITFRDTFLLVRADSPEQQKRTLGYINAHELAHQWFGNLVTMPWWDDIWLNEAFATWMGTHAISAVHPEYEAELGALSATHGAMEVDSRAAARKIRQPIESDHDIENAFDAITYSKGGAVLSMFERYLGAEKFRDGLRAYMERYRFGNATARDLVRALSEVSGESSLEPAFFSFLEQPGVPLLQVNLDCKSSPPTLELTQARYLPLGSQADPGGPWQVPVCVRYGEGRRAAKEQCTLLSEASARVPLETKTCPSWLMPNAGAQGYYRWVLSDAARAALISRRTVLSQLEQMSLASNVAAAFRAGRLEPAPALAVQKLLAASQRRQVVESALKTYWQVRELLDDASLPAFRAELARTLKPAYQKLGLVPKKKDVSGEEKLWRASVVRALFGLAEDPELTRELAERGRLLLEADGQESAAQASEAGAPEQAKPSARSARAQAELPSELIELALTAAVREAGAPLFERAEQKLFASEDGVLRTRLLSAMSYTRDPALGARALALGLDPRLRTNERLIPLSAQSSMPETRERAFSWLREHFDAQQAQVGAHGGNDLIASAGGFCSEAKAREVDAFFAPKSPRIPGGPRELALTLESIRSCGALLEAYGPALRALYAGQPPKRELADAAR